MKVTRACIISKYSSSFSSEDTIHHSPAELLSNIWHCDNLSAWLPRNDSAGIYVLRWVVRSFILLTSDRPIFVDAYRKMSEYIQLFLHPDAHCCPTLHVNVPFLDFANSASAFPRCICHIECSCYFHFFFGLNVLVIFFFIVHFIENIYIAGGVWAPLMV